MKFNDLKSELDNNVLRKLYLFTGPEREVMQRYIKRINPNVQKAQTLASIIPRLSTKNLFNASQTYVIEDDKGATEMDFAEIRDLVGANRIILVYKDIDKRKKLFKTAKDNIVEFERFTDSQLIFFVQRELDVDDGMAAMIARYSGNDVARIESECQKLKLLEKEITFDLIAEMIHVPVEDRIFDMIDNVARKNGNAAFKLYYDLLELKTSPIAVVSLLYLKFKHIFLVQSYVKEQNQVITAKTGLNHFQINQTRNLTGYFAPEDIIEMMRRIQLTEVDMKTGQVEQFTAMESLLVDILK